MKPHFVSVIVAVMGLTVGIVGLVIGVVLATRPHTCNCPVNTQQTFNCTSANVAPFYFSARLKTIVWNDSLNNTSSQQFIDTRAAAIANLSDILNQVQPTFYRDIAQSGDVALQLDVTRFEQMQGGDDHAVAYASGAYIGPPSKLPTVPQITNALNANTTVDYVDVKASSTDMCNGMKIPTVTTAAPSTFSTQSGVTTTTSMLITTTTTQSSCPQPTPCPQTPTPVTCPPSPPTPSCASATTQSTIPIATGSASVAPTTSVVPLTSALPGSATSAAPPGTSTTGAPMTAAASQGPTIVPGTSATGAPMTAAASQGPTAASGTSATGVPMTAGSQGPTAAPGTSATGGSITGASAGPTAAPGTSATGGSMTGVSAGPTAAPGTSATGGSMTGVSAGPTTAPGTSNTGAPMTAAASAGPTAAPGTSATGGSMTGVSAGPTAAPGTSATGAPMTAAASQGPTAAPGTSAPTSSGGSTPASPPQSAAPTTVAVTSQLPIASTGALTTAGVTSVTTGHTAPTTRKRLQQNIAIVYDMSATLNNPSLFNTTYAYLTTTFMTRWTIDGSHANVAPVPFPDTNIFDGAGFIGSFYKSYGSVINQFKAQYQAVTELGQAFFPDLSISDIQSGLSYVQTSLITDPNNRPNVINTVIVLATSTSEVSNAMATANALKSNGITILTIALGSADANTLGSLATPNNVFSLQDPSNSATSTATADDVYAALLNIPNGSVVEPVG